MISNDIGSSESSNSNINTKASTALSSDSKTAYYTPSGKSYHYDTNCRTISKSKTKSSQTLGEALSSSHSDPCDICTY
jgi:competence protein ComEC